MHMCTTQIPRAFIVLVTSGSIPANAPLTPPALQSPDTEVLSLRFNISQKIMRVKVKKGQNFERFGKLKSIIGPRTVDS